MDARTAIRFGIAFAGLGDKVGNQVEDVIDCGASAEGNPHAIRIALERLAGMCPEVDQALIDWLAEREPEHGSFVCTPCGGRGMLEWNTAKERHECGQCGAVETSIDECDGCNPGDDGDGDTGIGVEPVCALHNRSGCCA